MDLNNQLQHYIQVQLLQDLVNILFNQENVPKAFKDVVKAFKDVPKGFKERVNSIMGSLKEKMVINLYIHD